MPNPLETMEPNTKFTNKPWNSIPTAAKTMEIYAKSNNTHGDLPKSKKKHAHQYQIHRKAWKSLANALQVHKKNENLRQLE